MSSEGRHPRHYRAPKRALETDSEDSFREAQLTNAEASFRKDDVAEETEQTRVPGWRLARLSEAEREVFVSIDENGLRPVDLVDHTNWSESTIRTLLSRARKKLNQ